MLFEDIRYGSLAKWSHVTFPDLCRFVGNKVAFRKACETNLQDQKLNENFTDWLICHFYGQVLLIS